MGRDLLYKPPVPVVQAEDSPAKPGQKPGARTQHGRELGNVGKAFEVPAGYTAPSKTAAYKSAYFNQDTSGVRQVNLRQTDAAALRGAETAVDLKKVVLPPPAGVEAPEPAQLRGTGDLMGLDGSFELSLDAFLGRQSAWAKGKGASIETLRARLAELERLVEDRRQALARLAKQGRKRRAASVTIEQATVKEGRALTGDDDVVAAGRELVQRTAGQADGMHRRIAKMLGIKRAPG